MCFLRRVYVVGKCLDKLQAGELLNVCSRVEHLCYECEGNNFVRNFGSNLPDYTVS